MLGRTHIGSNGLAKGSILLAGVKRYSMTASVLEVRLGVSELLGVWLRPCDKRLVGRLDLDLS